MAKAVSKWDRTSMFQIVRDIEGKGHSGTDKVVEEINLLGGLTAKVERRAFYEKGTRGNKKARVYLHIEDESLAENLVNRRNRPVTEWRKIVQQVLWHYNMETKFNWSQYAGCSCPCSPGFVLDAFCHGAIYIDVKYNNNLLNDGNEQDLAWYANQFGIEIPTFENAIMKDEVLV